ncbi:MAG: hypothetical protein GY932_10240 [Arcobacter sp.]|jgi:hypothetical protein|nr:hypothetical protein [Arcobacter sp.]
MAIIYSYPEKTSPAGGDFLVITDSEQPAPNKNRTKSLTIDNLASYITTSTSGITGSGTLNTIAMFTPSGQAIGDSGITQSSPEIIKIGTGIAGGASVLETNLLTCNIISGANLLTIQGNSIIGNEATDILQIVASVSDYTGTASTAAGQILVSNASSQLEWDDAADVVSGAVTKLTPYFQIATPGGSATYTQSNNIVDFDWSGGSGTYEYILPSATAIPYRKIRFVNNSTVSASNKIHITAPGTETIDGGAFYEINKAYNGCAVWSDGAQWIVIQAKA